MKIIEIKDSFIKLESEERFPLTSFLKIEDEFKTYIAQVVKVANFSTYYGIYAKILFNYDGELKKYDGSIPFVESIVSECTSEVINNTILTCKYRNYSYEYTFDKDNKLIKIFNSYSFNSEDKTVYEDTLNTYISRSKDINNMGGNSKVINDDENNTFVFENIIDKEIDLSSIDVNYFVLSSNYNDVLNQLSGKGFDCK